MKNLKSLHLGRFLLLLLLLPLFTYAQNTRMGAGNIKVRAVVTGACSIGGAAIEKGKSYHLSEKLDFDKASYFGEDTVDAHVSVKYDCLSENGLKIYVDSSANDNGDGAERILKQKGGNSKVKYAIFSDSARTNILSNGDLLFEGDSKIPKGDIPIYGRAYINAQSNSNYVPAGEYEDTIKFSIEF